jgi:hypothetical protein
MQTGVSRRALLALAPLALVGSMSVALAAPMSFSVALTGAQQAPPVTTSGSGTANLTYDAASRVLTWSVTYTGLSGPATMAHFHGPADAGKNAGVVIWISEHGGTPASPMTGQATLTPDQATQFVAGQWYVNVHTKDHPGGEIRGQVMPPKS